ncbi:MAG: septum formation initiator family protein [Clostridiales bacterium]|nr:septum formation initiator family protein [Clostridiales bacterium]
MNRNIRRRKQHIRVSKGGYALVALLILAFAVGIFCFNARITSTRARIKQVSQDNAALQKQLDDLESELAFVKTPEGIELYARAQGMSMPGETRYTPVR